MAAQGKIAFFTPEIALHQNVHVYSGGLGVFSGSMLMSAYKLGISMVGVSLLYRNGYYDQYIDGDRMGYRFVDRQPEELQDTGLIFPVYLRDHTPILTKVWLLPEGTHNSVSVYFLDTDIAENNWLSQSNCHQLYPARVAGSTLERRIVQSIILGQGGVEALRRLHVPILLYHINESHAGFVASEVLADFLRRGISLEDAIRRARKQTVFTTHTPVEAGNPRYDFKLVAKLYGNGALTADVLRHIGGGQFTFNMAASALRLSGRANAVSERHFRRAEKLWAWLGDDLPPLYAITNGVNRDFWQYEKFRNARTAEDMAAAKRLYKERLAQVLREGNFLGLDLHTAGRNVNPDVFTLVWARRFAEYKRPKLLIRGENFEWLKALLYQNKLQIIFAGKPHLDDDDMIKVWNEFLCLSRELPNFFILPGYELEMSKLLKAGADLWLNTPRAPDEACGTSGMSAAMNGALNISILDGWMLEANKENFFPFGSQYPVGSAADQDSYDAERLREGLPVPMHQYYFDRQEWNGTMLRAKNEAEERWTSDRMLRKYQDRLYAK